MSAEYQIRTQIVCLSQEYSSRTGLLVTQDASEPIKPPRLPSLSLLMMPLSQML